MSFRPLLSSLGLGLLLLGCESKTPEREAAPATTTSSATTPPKSNTKNYGEPLTMDTQTDLGELLRFPEPFAGKTLLVEGTVRRSCSKKGCWLELATAADPKAPSCRVTFKDYGFFVPTDAAGSRARIEGVLEVKEVSKAHVDHLEAEGATFEDKQPDGGVQEVRLVATGVELTRS